MTKKFIKLTPVPFLALFLFGLIVEGVENSIDPDREIAIVRRYIPNVDITGAVRDTVVETGTSLFSGDTLTTDENGYALVMFLDQSVAKVRPRSQLIIRGEIDRRQNASTRIDLNRGGIFLNVNRRVTNEFEVTTSTTVASVKGTTFGALSEGYYWVETGEVEVMALRSGQSVLLTEGMFAQADESGSDLTTGQLSDGEIERLNSEYKTLDEELIERRLILRFRDSNGQIIEEDIEFFEQNDN
ncbi:FecR family protein [Rhodohalobacter halophilus]|uniref:FecR family protein n=1 Tax=Rhodohalobacter halophilus TaxID=1812810 RepID=UPI00083F9313|nr:FecR family protein [Rhodohalobacter halophilus]